MKVFVSSVVAGMEPHRDAAAKAARMLKHEVLRSEDFGASPGTPQRVCLAAVRAADVVLLLLGKRYGTPQDSGLSPTHEEFREAKDRCRVLVFVENLTDREPDQSRFLEEAQAWGAGLYTSAFSTPDDLQEAIVAALHQLELSVRTGPVDENEMVSRGQDVLGSRERMSGRSSVRLAIVGAPRQQILRPMEIESSDFGRELTQALLFGEFQVFTSERGTHRRVADDRLEITQDDRAVTVDQAGTVVITLPTQEDERKGGLHLFALVEEEVLEQLHRMLRLGAWLLDRIDATHRLQEVAPLACLANSGYLGWMTKESRQKNPNSVPAGLGGREDLIVHLHPANRRREALQIDSRRIAEDLTVLLRRQKRG